MVTKIKSASVRRDVDSSKGWITPSPKRVRLTSPFTDVESDDDLEDTVFDSNSDSNIIVQQSRFLKFIGDNFVCKHCSSKFRDRSIVVDRIGFASNVFWKCTNRACPGEASIRATTCQVEASGKTRRKNPTTPSVLSDYTINRQVVLACQQSGGGARMATTFGGLLLVSRRSIWMECFSKVEQLIGKFQIALGKKIVAKNLRDEIALSPMNDDLQKAQLTLLMDGGWDQRASGKAYNSSSGRHVSVGGRTNKVCALVYYSKRCSKCEKGKPHPTDLCANPDKYAKSSKAMEALGAVETVLDIWQNCTNAYVATIVTDEDTTTRSKLSHSMADLVAAGRLSEADRRYKPKVEGNLGSKKDDFGMLPLLHPEIEKQSDPGHYVKNYQGELYVWVHAAKGKSQTCKADAMRLSRNLSYMLKQYQRGTEKCTFEKFETAAKASFEHHWNNHEFCGSWCQAKDWNGEEKEKHKNKYRNKDTHRKEYEQQFEIHKKFTETDRMRRVFHEFSTNKTEQIHSLVTNVFLPKRSYYCRTICGKARTYLAVSIDSLGYYKYNKLLYHELGLEMSCITEVFYQQQDKRRESDQAYANKPERRKLRAEQRLENINKEWQKEVIDKKNGNTYQSAMTAPKGAAAPLPSGDATSSEEAIENEGVNKSAVVAPRFCNACQNYGHQRRSSRLCPKNKKSKYYEGKTVQSYRNGNTIEKLLPM